MRNLLFLRALRGIALVALIGFTLAGCPNPGGGGGFLPVPPPVSAPALTGSVSISGTAEVGETLTADTTDLGGSGTISYQWKRNSTGGGTGTTNIGVNSETYEITAEDIGSTITVTVKRSGNSGSKTSEPTAFVTDPELDALSGSVSITGTTIAGQTLTAVTTSLDGSGDISYQWKRNSGETAAVIGTNSSTYVLQIADAGSTITVTVTRTGNSGSKTSSPTAIITLPALTGTVSISGTPVTGQTLTAVTTSLGGSGTISYQWKHGNDNIVGANGVTYILQTTDEGYNITVTVTRAENSGSITSSPTAAVTLPALTGTVGISGNAYVGQTLTAVTASLRGSGDISYQWKRGATDIAGANSNTYTVVAADLGSTITVTVTRTGNSGSVTSVATANVILPPLTGTVSISGTAHVAQTLTAVTTSLNGSGDISYQWKRGETEIGTNSTYTVALADLGSRITVTVTRADNSGSVSAQTAVVALSALTGSVSISGTPVAGQTLTAVTTFLNGSGDISYQWRRGATNITGANGVTYTLQTADAGYTITVNVTRTDNSGSVTSGATATVTLPALTGSVGISGNNVWVGETLTADTTDLGGSGTISYQWRRGATNITGATNTTYVVQTADVGSTITVTVTRAGNSGSVTSGATVTVILSPLTGTVSISGTAQVGQTLTAVTTSLNGSGTITYQWKRGETVIGTNSTYTVAAADVSSIITVTVTRSGNSGSVNAETTTIAPAVISLNTVAGVNAPVFGATPVTAITETAQYTGTVTWNGNPSTFAAATVYTATITLTAKTGYTLTGVGANFFAVAGAESVSNAVNSGVITAVFPKTSSDGAGIFTITFAGITDASPLIVDQAISRSGVNGPKTVTLNVDNPGQYTSIEWRVTGTPEGGTGASFILNSANAAYNSVGVHFLTVEVLKDGIPYNKSITFTVKQ